jgi:hypothetical protein
VYQAFKNYVCRLLDATDRSADCLAFGILIGFAGFNFLFGLISFVFVAHSLFPNRVDFQAGQVAAMVTSLAGSYAGVLTSTSAAYRWRQNGTAQEKAPEGSQKG